MVLLIPGISEIIENIYVLLKSWLLILWFYYWCQQIKNGHHSHLYLLIGKFTKDWTGTILCQSEIQDGQQSVICFKIGFCKMSYAWIIIYKIDCGYWKSKMATTVEYVQHWSP